MTMHRDQLQLTEETVRALLADQLPALAARPVRLLPQAGTVNAIARLGEDLAARFPLQPADPEDVRRTLEREADAARRLVGGLRVPVPAPVALGGPGHGYPLPWSVQTWVPGSDAFAVDPGASEPFARDLAALVAALRTLPTEGCTFV